MTLESTLADLADASKRLSSQRLVDLCNLDAEESALLAGVWPELEPRRRRDVLALLTDLAQDNVELNFDAVFKHALRDEEPVVRSAALRGLYEYEGRDLISRLVAILEEDPEAEVRREAAVALGRFALAAELGELRDDDAGTIRAALMQAVENMQQDEGVRARAIEALGALSGEEAENLIESVYQEDSIWMKVGAVDAMGRSSSATWLPLIVREMENRSPEMRSAAAFAAGGIGDEKAVGPLTALAAHDPDTAVVRTAIQAISEIGGPKAQVALKKLLYEGDDSLHEAIQEAIREMSFRDDPLDPPGR